MENAVLDTNTTTTTTTLSDGEEDLLTSDALFETPLPNSEDETGDISPEIVADLSAAGAEADAEGLSYKDEDGITHEVEPEALEEGGNAYKGIAYEEATEVLRTLQGKKDFVAWTAGDILVGMTEDLPKKQVAELLVRISQDTRIEPDTVQQYLWVAKKFPPGPVRDDYAESLTWSHFRACAALENPTEYLDKAAQELWSVGKLMEQLALNRENAKIEAAGGCARPGCRCGVSLVSSERVSMQVYGAKMTFCSAACAANILLNGLYSIAADIKNQDRPQTSMGTILVSNPDTAQRDKQPETDWFAERQEREILYFAPKNNKSKVVQRAAPATSPAP
jgi:hypothetical protein